MTEQLTFVLDGMEVEAAGGESILDVARRLGKHIPTLCHDPRLEPFASCYLCLVELEGKAGFVPSCSTKVAAGMKVKTDSEQIQKARKLCLELLMSAHNADCLAPCRLQCPDNIDIQSYIAAIALGEFDEALRIIKRTNPFPSVCGRVCPHTCELQCRRNKVDEPVAINPLKRFVADLDAAADKPYLPPVAPETGTRVAIIGAGPAGLTAAYYLRQKGHAVSVFEMNDQAGGMLRYGIPRYRLPDKALDAEINNILALGVALHCNKTLGKDFTLASLKRDGYDAAFLTVGAWVSSKMDVAGEELPGVLAGIRFLYDVATGKKPDLGKRVVVVGGGNTAIDAARTSMRLGAEVTILYRRTRKEMPAEPFEVDEAEHEGVTMHFLAAPVKLIEKNGRVSAIQSLRMELGEPDASGRRRPVPIPGSEFEVPADTVIAAIGQRPNPEVWKEPDGPAATKWATVKADETTYQTEQPWIFTAGDCLTGASTAIEAIAGGRKAAISIDRFLNGLQPLPIGKPFSDSIGRLEDLDEDLFADVPKVPRAKMICMPFEQRQGSFNEVEFGIARDNVLAEANRCLECGCQAVEECTLREVSDEFGVRLDRFKSNRLIHPVRDDHPFISFDQNKCILCGRCVRICLEQQGLGALGFVNRGFDTVIQPSLAQPLLQTDCDACGQCVSSCPTGAFAAKRFVSKPGPFYADSTTVVCGFCGVGCALEIETVRGRYLRAKTEPGSKHNRGNLCVDGSFGHRYLETLPRLHAPRVGRGKKGRATTWEEALAAAARGLTAAAVKGLAVIVNGPLTNEATYVLQRLARVDLQTNNLFSLDGPSDALAFEQAVCDHAQSLTLDSLRSADLFWVVGTDPFEYAPITGIELHQAVQAGARLVMLGSWPSRLDEKAERVVHLPDDRLPKFFATLEKYAGSGAMKDLNPAVPLAAIRNRHLAELVAQLKEARRPVVVIPDSLEPNTVVMLTKLLSRLNQNDRMLVLRRGGNAQGRLTMGLHPAMLPGQVDVRHVVARERFEKVWGVRLPVSTGLAGDELLKALKKGALDGALLINTDPYGWPLPSNSLHKKLFVVAADLAPGMLAERADVLLPSAGLAEESGTVFSQDHRLLKTRAVRPPLGGRTMFELVQGLATALGHKPQLKDPAACWTELGDIDKRFDVQKAS
jgi:formate dehydrogenase major subunit